MPAAYPREFRQDVVAIARKGQMPIAQVAKDFGIAESCLRRWLAQDDVEAGIRPGITKAENEELKALSSAATASWRWRTRSYGVRPRICPRRT